MCKNIESYRKNNLPIPFELSYNNKIKLHEKILLKCEKCELEYIHVYSVILRRKYEPNKPICTNCLLKMGYKVRVELPWELKQLGKNPIPWELYLKYKDKYNDGCKKWIKIICQECGEEKLIQWRRVKSRNYSKDLPICSDCIDKYVSSLPEVRKINSEAQKIAQNRPGAKEKMSKIIKNKIKNDKDFRDKITRYSRKLCGYYNGIRFNSSWELSIIDYYGDQIRGCEISIPYMYLDKEHLYLPDFDLFLDDKKYLVEVKGQYRERDKMKIKAAKELINRKELNYDDMIVIDKNNIKKLKGIKFFTSKDSLNILTGNLKILSYPKNWI